MHLFFVLFSLQFHETSTIFGLKNFQTFYKRTLCGWSLLAVFLKRRSEDCMRSFRCSQQSFNKSPNILCNRLRSAIKQKHVN